MKWTHRTTRSRDCLLVCDEFFSVSPPRRRVSFQRTASFRSSVHPRLPCQTPTPSVLRHVLPSVQSIARRQLLRDADRDKTSRGREQSIRTAALWMEQQRRRRQKRFDRPPSLQKIAIERSSNKTSCTNILKYELVVHCLCITTTSFQTKPSSLESDIETAFGFIFVSYKAPPPSSRSRHDCDCVCFAS